jgi:DedD protein
MGLLSIFKRQEDAAAPAATAPDAVVVARTRARRRLIGATLLLAVGVVGFPLLFETQPRPIPIDIPIEIPRKESAPALALPPARPASAAVVVPMEPTPDTAPATSVVAAAPPPPAPATVAPSAARSPAASAANRPTAAAATVAPAEAKPTATPASQAVPAAKPNEARRAQALLDGSAAQATKSDEAAASSRVVVQVGAYTDADKLREARHKVEKLGMKTYTQVVESEGSRRTRVRVGPFATRAEAEKAAARIKSTGLPAAILSL